MCKTFITIRKPVILHRLKNSGDERLETIGRRKLLQYYRALVKLVALGIRKEGLDVKQMSTGPWLIFSKSCYSDDQQLATLSFVYSIFLLLNLLKQLPSFYLISMSFF